MSGLNIPADLVAFILGNLRSVEQLDILLLLFRGRSETFTTDRIDQHLRTNAVSITRRIKDLQSRNLVVGSVSAGVDVYQITEDSNVLRVCHELAYYYASHQSVIIELIYSRPQMP